MVEILRRPVDRRSAGLVGLGVDRFDQCPTDAHASGVGVGIEVLQIADVLDLPAMAVKQVVCQSDQSSVLDGNEAGEILRIVTEKPRKSCRVDLIRHGGLVECQVAAPEHSPGVVIVRAQEAHADVGMGHHCLPARYGGLALRSSSVLYRQPTVKAGFCPDGTNRSAPFFDRGLHRRSFCRDNNVLDSAKKQQAARRRLLINLRQRFRYRGARNRGKPAP